MVERDPAEEAKENAWHAKARVKAGQTMISQVQKELEKAHIKGLVDGAEGNKRLVARMKELGR